ncbi:hypothetical protein DFH08DRAFT_875034 [Mycena albidolilacea]|uniref:Uncharacterized protein n=1 Tax=Mycena albidolilacea TaxID=1033008 RepID=A0AAD6ZV07_9AGAR|nr:hypothetical protein DFH08DRAFT_875034 [Mycena albidolilacea]
MRRSDGLQVCKAAWNLLTFAGQVGGAAGYGGYNNAVAVHRGNARTGTVATKHVIVSATSAVYCYLSIDCLPRRRMDIFPLDYKFLVAFGRNQEGIQQDASFPSAEYSTANSDSSIPSTDIRAWKSLRRTTVRKCRVLSLG